MFSGTFSLWGVYRIHKPHLSNSFKAAGPQRGRNLTALIWESVNLAGYPYSLRRGLVPHRSTSVFRPEQLLSQSELWLRFPSMPWVYLRNENRRTWKESPSSSQAAPYSSPSIGGRWDTRGFRIDLLEGHRWGAKLEPHHSEHNWSRRAYATLTSTFAQYVPLCNKKEFYFKYPPFSNIYIYISTKLTC
jgi:hypothetical protein